MAKNTFADLDTTSANNTDLLGNNVTGNADANTIDTIVQAFAAMTARFYGDIGGLGTVGGSANAITLTSLSTYQALESGLVLTFKASAANTGATTLNLDGIGTKAVRRKGGAALTGGEIAANGRYLVVYDEAYNSAAGAWVLLNPEVAPRVTTISSSATPAVNADNCDSVDITALAVEVTSMTASLSGTPTNFQKLIYRIKDNGTARAISWGASFEAKGVALPVTTTVSRVLTVGFIYDAATSKWGCVASAQES